jgi:hypothetical protein
MLSARDHIPQLNPSFFGYRSDMLPAMKSPETISCLPVDQTSPFTTLSGRELMISLVLPLSAKGDDSGIDEPVEVEEADHVAEPPLSECSGLLLLTQAAVGLVGLVC